jgi:hypothetical protein
LGRHRVQAHQLVDDLVGCRETARRCHEHAVIWLQIRCGEIDGVRQRGDDRAPNDRVEIVRRIFELLVSCQKRYARHVVDAVIAKSALHDLTREARIPRILPPSLEDEHRRWQ